MKGIIFFNLVVFVIGIVKIWFFFGKLIWKVDIKFCLDFVKSVVIDIERKEIKNDIRRIKKNSLLFFIFLKVRYMFVFFLNKKEMMNIFFFLFKYL